MPKNLPTNRLPLRDDNLCFGCGSANPIGLQLRFAWDGDWYQTRWTPDIHHQGWASRVHGGLLATVLDETLSRAALERHGLEWVTAELTTRLRRPAFVGKTLVVRARLEIVRSKLIVCTGEVVDETSGEQIAVGQAKLMRVK